MPALDTDKDSVVDSTDNCPDIANGDQKNTDGDGIGDVCDLIDVTDTGGEGVPTINSVQGKLTTDTSIIINGAGFTDKINAKPLFWWKADFGTSPSLLGRMIAWSDDENLGDFSTTIVAPGSQKSAGTDYGSSSGIALPVNRKGVPMINKGVVNS